MVSRNIEQARKAYVSGDAEGSRRAHERPAGGRASERHTRQGQYIKSVVYGGLDGIVTTFAVVAGVTGASLSSGIVLVLGFANLIADGLSMAVGDYLSTKSENEYNAAERAREVWEVEHYPDGEEREMIDIYTEKGVPETDARAMVGILARHKEAWVDVMMVEELGIVQESGSPVKNAIVTFSSFVMFGFVPLCAYTLSLFVPWFAARTFLVACVLTAITLFVLGAARTKVTAGRWYVSGFEMLVIGGLAAVAAYIVGVLLGGLAE